MEEIQLHQEVNCYYAEEKFSIWKWLGFREVEGLNPEDANLFSTTCIYIDFLDRIRILVSGKAMLRTKMVVEPLDCQVKESASYFSILQPNYRMGQQVKGE